MEHRERCPVMNTREKKRKKWKKARWSFERRGLSLTTETFQMFSTAIHCGENEKFRVFFFVVFDRDVR